MDQTTFDESFGANNDTNFMFNSRQSVWIADSNSGSYSSAQIQFDLANFANSAKFIDWKSSVLVIPLCLSVVSSAQLLGTATNTPTTNTENNFIASLKNGVYQIINSMSLSLTNNEVISIQNFNNLLINYKILSSVATSDIANIGSTLLFEKDSAFSSQFISNAAGSLIGQGSCNNIIGCKNGTGSTGINSFDCGKGYNFTQNLGRLSRMTSTSCSDTDLSSFVSAGYLDKAYKHNVSDNTKTNVTYHITATIPMMFLHDFFLKAPLMKNAYYKLTINTNTNVTVTQTIAATLGTVTVTSVTSPNGVCPFMLSPTAIAGSSTGDGFIVQAGAQTITSTLKIVTGQTGSTPHPLNQCRIYGSLIEMTPQYEADYLSNKVKTFVYNDFLSFNNMQNQAAGGSINQLLTPGLSRLRRLIIFPFITAVANGHQTAMAGVSPMNSPYASEPATCSPYCSVSNFNVFLSGQPIFNQNKMYNFENYLEECRPALSLNGGLTMGLTTGLISQMEHDANYGFIVVNLARHNKEVDSISKSVQVSFTNNSKFACDYICIVEYEKQITVDCELGQLQV